MGKTSGSLYSAIVHAQPEAVIAITAVNLTESAYLAAEAAGMSREHLTVRVFIDPYGGVDEKDEVLGDLDDLLASAREVVLCLTGGSTLTNSQIVPGNSICQFERLASWTVVIIASKKAIRTN